MTTDIIYDIECYPNVFTISFLNPLTNDHRTFEMSDFKDDWAEFRKFVTKCQDSFVRWVGFNNYYYDYQVIHKCLEFQGFDTLKDKAGFAYRTSSKIINMDKEEKFLHVVWSNDHYVPQLDLYRIHHFDNNARATSLKKLEFNMCSRSIQDLPYPIGTTLDRQQIKELIRYNVHDCSETAKFFHESKDMISFREGLTTKYDRDFMNHNDAKIGKDYFIMELENAGIKCFHKIDNKKVPIQTLRPFMRINDLIFDYVEFDKPEFNAVLGWLRKQTIHETKGVFTGIDDLGELEQYSNLKQVKGLVKNLNCIIDGFQFDFGTGGIHGSVLPTIVEANADFAIIDYDVTSLYPSIAIANQSFPEHLTSKFCDIYGNMKNERLSHAKGTPENAMLKLALNGVYGDSNNPYSCFFDPQYTMTITINGQLMLCMLAEKIMEVEGVRVLQINTDGITIKVPRCKINNVEHINRTWEELTGLDLERVDYSKFCIRDVNNYLAQKTDGEIKRKGAYEYKMAWHQNRSSLVIQKAVEAHLTKGVEIDWFIRDHDNVNDFMLRTNVPRSSRLLLDNENTITSLQNTTRYYMSTDGGQLVKIMPPLAKFKTLAQMDEAARTPGLRRKFETLIARRKKYGLIEGERIINIQDGCKATPMNTMGELFNIDYEWYIIKANELVHPLWSGALDDLL